MPEYELEDVLEVVHGSGLPALPEVADALQVLYATGLWEWSQVFEATRRAKEAVDHLEREAVRWARLEGLSWEEIGDELGITGPGARKRYVSTGRHDLEELDALDERHAAEMHLLHSEMKLAVARARRELADASDEQEDLLTALNQRVLVEQGFWERMMQLIDEHSKARRELVRQLEQDSD